MTEVVEVLTLMKPCFPDADNEPLIFPQGESLQFQRTAKSRFNILTIDGATNHASKRLDFTLFLKHLEMIEILEKSLPRPS